MRQVLLVLFMLISGCVSYSPIYHSSYSVVQYSSASNVTSTSTHTTKEVPVQSPPVVNVHIASSAPTKSPPDCVRFTLPVETPLPPKPHFSDPETGAPEDIHEMLPTDIDKALTAYANMLRDHIRNERSLLEQAHAEWLKACKKSTD
jgi:hypothetical protein